MSERWRIGELERIVGRALAAAGYDGQASGRVRHVPDARTIRYYTTLGLLDRPLEMRGRTAYYGRRHVLQLVAIKWLQSQGTPLVDVQRQLLAASDEQLAAWAKLPSEFWEQAAPAAAAPVCRACFWADSPAADDDEPKAPFPCDPPEPTAVRHAVHVTLSDGVSLVIEGADATRLTQEGIRQLGTAARGLLETLARLGLCADPEDGARTDNPEPRNEN